MEAILVAETDGGTFGRGSNPLGTWNFDSGFEGSGVAVGCGVCLYSNVSQKIASSRECGVSKVEYSYCCGGLEVDSREGSSSSSSSSPLSDSSLSSSAELPSSLLPSSLLLSSELLTAATTGGTTFFDFS